MNYKALKALSDSIAKAIALKAIAPAEGITLSHHMRLSGRGAYRYVSTGDRALIADIAKRVRVACSGGGA